MEARQDKSLLGQLVKAWRLDFTPIWPYVTEAKVVGYDNEEIGALCHPLDRTASLTSLTTWAQRQDLSMPAVDRG